MAMRLEKHFSYLSDGLRVVRTGRPTTFEESNQRELDILSMIREIGFALMNSGKVFTM